MLWLLHRLLDIPLIFDWQQRLCNNYRGIRDEFADYLGRAGLDVLDVGCSTGACAGTILSMKDNRYTGIDIDPRYVRRAARRYPDGTFLVMDARDLAFATASFDLILFVGALHHMDDAIIRGCMKELRRVLRPDGVVLCAEPVFTPGRRLSTFFLRRDRGRHIREPEGYARLFDGLEVARRRFFDFSIHRFVSFVLRRRIDGALAA
jgi:ubiquinone/menaquinone biosynthesis C-methylase UbiE